MSVNKLAKEGVIGEQMSMRRQEIVHREISLVVAMVVITKNILEMEMVG